MRSEGVRGWCNQSRWLAVIQSANGAVWANAVRGLKTGRKKGQARGLVTSAGSAPAGNSLKNYAHMAEHLVPNRVCVPGELKKGAGRTLPSNKACTELRHEDSTERISCVFSSRCCFATPEFVFNTTDSYVRSDASLLRGELSGVGQRTCSVSLSAAGPPVAGPVWSTTQAACQAAGRGCPSDRAEGNTTCPRSGGVYEHVVSTNIEPHPHLTYRCVCMYAHVRVRECVLCVERVNLSLGG